MTIKKTHAWIWGIFGVLVLLTLSLALLFNHTRPGKQEAPEPAVLNFNSAQLSKYLGGEISHYLPIEKLDIAFFEDGKIAFSAVFEKTDIQTLLAEKQPALQYAAELLPDKIDTHLALRLLHTGNTISVEPISFKVASFDLTSWLSQKMVDSLNRKIAQYFTEKQIKLRSFKVLSDAISMEIHRNFT